MSCVACGRPSHAHVCRPMREAMWAIVKDKGGGTAHRWARYGLGLDEMPDAPVAATPPRSHTHGWGKRDGEWRCVQDFYATGFASETGCGEAWPT